MTKKIVVTLTCMYFAIHWFEYSF